MATKFEKTARTIIKTAKILSFFVAMLCRSLNHQGNNLQQINDLLAIPSVKSLKVKRKTPMTDILNNPPC